MSDLKDLSSWNLVQVSFFLAWKVQKSHLEYTKTNQCSVISHFKFLLCLTRSGTGKVCGTTVIPKKIFSLETKVLAGRNCLIIFFICYLINLSSCCGRRRYLTKNVSYWHIEWIFSFWPIRCFRWPMWEHKLNIDITLFHINLGCQTHPPKRVVTACHICHWFDITQLESYWKIEIISTSMRLVFTW